MGVLSSIKTKLEERRSERTYKAAAEKTIKQKTRAEYYRAKEAQERRYLKEKAKAETDAKIKAYKASLTQKTSKPRGTNWQGIATGLGGASQGMMNFMTGGMGGFSPPTPRTNTLRRTTTTKRGRKTTTKKRRKRKPSTKRRNTQPPPNPWDGFGF